MLTGPQVAKFAFSSSRVANRRLAALYEWRVVDRFQPYLTVGSAPMHYVLDTAGAAMLAAEDDLADTPAASAKSIGYRHDRAMEFAHSLRLAHTVGVNGFFADLVAVAHRPGGGGSNRALTTWWSEARCGRHFGEFARPDAYGRWYEDGDEVEFFLEYDCGTEALSRVAAKLAGYERLAIASGIATPVLIWLPGVAREEAARPLLSTALGSLQRPDLVPLATTATCRAGAGRAPDSPAASRWLPLGASTSEGASRVRLARLARVWPHVVPPALDPRASDAAGSDDPGLRPPAPMPPTPWPGVASVGAA